MVKIKYPEFIRVFPNSTSRVFDSEESVEHFLKDDLPTSDTPNRYYSFNYSRLKNIGIGTLILFRFNDMIKGIATVESSAVYSPKNTDEGTYKGYITLRDIQLLPRPMMIEELEELTGISFHQKGRSYKTGGRVYQKIPELKIKNVVDRINEILEGCVQAGGDQKADSGRTGFSNPDPELGRMGEEFILSLEADALKNSHRHPEKVRDGEGYDIKSWDDNGTEIHIEVKTTTGSLGDRIFWTQNEHYRSEKDPNFWIYRVYEFDKKAKRGRVKKIRGSFSDFFDFYTSLYYGNYKGDEVDRESVKNNSK